MKKTREIALLLIFIVLGLTGCAGSSQAGTYEQSEMAGVTMDADQGDIYRAQGKTEAAAVDNMSEQPASAENGTAGEVLDDNASTSKKLIKNVDLSVETKEFDKLTETITKRVNELGGYIESASTNKYAEDQGRTGNITARIPCEKLDGFITEVANQSNITSKNESVQDITLQYVDLESHKKSLETEQERLLALMEKAETVEDIIQIENRLSEVRYQLQSMESQLKTMDNQVTYSTVYIDIMEVKLISHTSELSTIEQIKAGFCNNMKRLGMGLKNIGIGILIDLPFIAFGIFIIAVFALIVKTGIKIHDGRRMKKNKRETTVLNRKIPAPKQPVGEEKEMQDGNNR